MFRKEKEERRQKYFSQDFLPPFVVVVSTDKIESFQKTGFPSPDFFHPLICTKKTLSRKRDSFVQCLRCVEFNVSVPHQSVITRTHTPTQVVTQCHKYTKSQHVGVRADSVTEGPSGGGEAFNSGAECEQQGN